MCFTRSFEIVFWVSYYRQMEPVVSVNQHFALFPEPYTPTGNFEVDFCELCTRADIPNMQVVPRPHRPPTPNVIPQDNTPVGKQDKKDGISL